MPTVLSHHSYGKSRIRLTKVTRRQERHDVRELTIDIALQGDFEGTYTRGDNRLIIPTDTMKNVALALAKEHSLESIEGFGLAIAGHFLEHHGHVTKVRSFRSTSNRWNEFALPVSSIPTRSPVPAPNEGSPRSLARAKASGSSRGSTSCSCSRRPTRPFAGS